MDIIFATKNEGKMKEIRMILSDSYFNVQSMEEAGIDIDVVEDGNTFEENAIKKAVEIMKLCEKTVIADDSGLEIDFLDKQPGVQSARFMGVNTPYESKNRRILEMLDGVPTEKRTARFVCAIAAAFPNGETVTTLATVEGLIAFEPNGSGGFGYDPIFFISEYNLTMSQISAEQKNEISHRGKALSLMKDILRKRT